MNSPQQSKHSVNAVTPTLFDTQAAKAAWSRLTQTPVLTPSEFQGRKAREGLVVVGVVGFNSDWSDRVLSLSAPVRADMRTAEARMEWDLARLKEQWGDKLVVAIHGGNEGIPAIAQQVCERLAIETVGFTSKQCFRPKCSGVDSLVVAGETLRDESQPLIGAADTLLVFGGGAIAKQEAMAFQAGDKDAWKNLFIYTMFGGVAGELRASQIPAMFVMS